MLRIKEIQASGLIEDEPTRNAPNLGQVTSGSIQSGASPYIQGHTLQGFKVKNSLNSYPARIQGQGFTHLGHLSCHGTSDLKHLQQWNSKLLIRTFSCLLGIDYQHILSQFMSPRSMQQCPSRERIDSARQTQSLLQKKREKKKKLAKSKT
jgi:hypothetical protein